MIENWLNFVSISRTGVRSHEFQSRITPVVRWPVASTLTARPSGDAEKVMASIGGSQFRVATVFPLIVKRESVENFWPSSTGCETTAKSPEVRLMVTILAGNSTWTLRTYDGLRRSQTTQVASSEAETAIPNSTQDEMLFTALRCAQSVTRPSFWCSGNWSARSRCLNVYRTVRIFPDSKPSQM